LGLQPPPELLLVSAASSSGPRELLATARADQHSPFAHLAAACELPRLSPPAKAACDLEALSVLAGALDSLEAAANCLPGLARAAWCAGMSLVLRVDLGAARETVSVIVSGCVVAVLAVDACVSKACTEAIALVPNPSR
jgi:hypothetical protein